jgi:hypothetical protein
MAHQYQIGKEQPPSWSVVCVCFPMEFLEVSARKCVCVRTMPGPHLGRLLFHAVV